MRIAQRMVTGAEALPLEGVGRLGDVIVQVDLQLGVQTGGRCDRLLGTLHRRADEQRKWPFGEVLRSPSRHPAPQGREMEVGDPAVQDSGGVVHLTVTQDVDGRGLVHRRSLLAHAGALPNHLCR